MKTHLHAAGLSSPSCGLKIGIVTLMSLLGLVCANWARAADECQAGFVPSHQGRHRVCVADYSLPFWKQQQLAAQRDSGEVWEDRHGAVAYSKAAKGYIIHTGALSEHAARESALAECGAPCEILGTFKNDCVAIGWGAGWAHLKRGSSRKEAEELALSSCRADPSSRIACEVLYADCSFPVRIR